MKLHNLKTWPEYFQAIVDGSKTFEIRKNDRDFKVNDLLCLKEYAPERGEYTNAWFWVKVTYILDKQPFVPEGYMCMGIKPCGTAICTRI